MIKLRWILLIGLTLSLKIQALGNIGAWAESWTVSYLKCMVPCQGINACECDYYPGYLPITGPTCLRFYSLCPPVDRNNLLSLTSAEEELARETMNKIQAAILDKAHEADLQRIKDNQAKAPYKVETPEVVVAPPPSPAPTGGTGNGPAYDPNEFFWLIKDHGSGDNKDKMVIPFQMPYQAGPSELLVPSKAIYERR